MIGCTSQADVLVSLKNNTVSPNSEWDELPKSIQEKYTELANEADPKQNLDRPPYPQGGMAGLMKRVTYPEKARQAEIEGLVVVEAVVTKDGSVREATVVNSAHPFLDTEALSTIQGAQFEPARVNGEPVLALICVPIRFGLR